jgi:hypothetical protein
MMTGRNYRPIKQQCDDQGRAQHLDRLKNSDDPPAVSAVCERAADQRQEPHLRVGEGIEADQKWGSSEADEKPWLATCCAQVPIFDSKVAAQNVPKRRLRESVRD